MNLTQRTRKQLLSVVGMCSALLFAPSIASGLTINLVLNEDFDPPSADPDRQKLEVIMAAAANYWTGLIKNGHTLTIEYGYQDLAPSVAGQAFVDGDDVNALGRATNAQIAFDTTINPQVGRSFERLWYYDPSPLNNSEFDMQQTLYGDLSAAAQNLYFNGSPPNQLEVGYQGLAKLSAPVAARDGSDLFTVALHEIGHVLGMLDPVAGTETMDGDYDFSSAFIGGHSAAAKVYSDPTSGTDSQHLRCADCLMFGGGGVGDGQRTLPSATDVFAIATGPTVGWSIFDLPRQDFLTGNDWHDPTNWEGFEVPDANDDAYVRHASASSVGVFSDGSVRNLTVAERSEVFIDNAQLNVFRLTVMAGPNLSGASSVTVGDNGELVAPGIDIEDGGEVANFGGFVDVEILRIHPGGSLLGNGRVSTDGALRNGGQIVASQLFGIGEDTLRIEDSSGNVDLDGGSENGALIARGANMMISSPGGMTDAFGGTMEIGAGREINFLLFGEWTMEGGGVIELDGGPSSSVSDRARLTARVVHFTAGDIEVSGNGSIIADIITFEPGIDVSLAPNANLKVDHFGGGSITVEGGDYTIADGAVLEFNDPVTVENANFIIPGNGEVHFDADTTYSFNTQITSTGMIRQNGDATIIGSMTVDGGSFDLDGLSGNTTIYLGNATNNGSLTLNVDAINTDIPIIVGDEFIFRGTIETAQAGIVGGLTINLTDPDHAWQMAGTLNLHGGNPIFRPTRVAGSKMFVTGEINLTNRVRIAADVDFLISATVNATGFNDELTVSGVTQIFSGADFNGLMTMINDASGDLTLHHGAHTPFVILENAGTLRIGDSPGLATVNHYTQTATGTWEVEVGGVTPGTGYDRLITINNTPAELAGTLDLETIDGFVPDYGDTFRILVYRSRNGVFDQVNGAILAPDLALGQFYETINPDALTLLATAPGDANGDLIVDISDFGMLAGNFNQPGTWETGDFDGNGITNINDFGLLAANFNGDFNTLMAAAESFGITTIPEPTTATLIGLIVLGLRRRLMIQPSSASPTDPRPTR